MMLTRCIPLFVVALGLFVVPPADAGPAETRGYLYGTIVTKSDHEYTGLLRWDNEEAFWDDLFNSIKTELPYMEEHGKSTRRRSAIKIFGFTVGYRVEDDVSARLFIARFGDLREIEVLRGDKVRVTMRGGEVYELDGGSNDIGAQVRVLDDSLGEVDLEWDRIERIVFRPTPPDVRVPAARLFGTVETDEGSFEGHIQWDVQECLFSDKLDGETRDGEMSIDMGKIRAIEKRNRSGSKVELKDGRTLVLEDTNDVDSSLRGIFVEDPRYGRVKIGWSAFERAEFRDAPDSGRGYDDYEPGRPLRGTVTDYDGVERTGRLVFDLDESRTWEMLNGMRGDVEFYIPFAMIRSIEPERGNASKVALRSGESLSLDETQDVSEINDGVVVLREDDRESYLPWDQVRRIDFD
jgi:hypothetical protein